MRYTPAAPFRGERVDPRSATSCPSSIVTGSRCCSANAANDSRAVLVRISCARSFICGSRRCHVSLKPELQKESSTLSTSSRYDPGVVTIRSNAAPAALCLENGYRPSSVRSFSCDSASAATVRARLVDPAMRFSTAPDFLNTPPSTNVWNERSSIRRSDSIIPLNVTAGGDSRSASARSGHINGVGAILARLVRSRGGSRRSMSLRQS